MATSKEAQKEFLILLSEKDVSYNALTKGNYVGTCKKAEAFSRCLSTLCNTFCFGRKELAEVILADHVMTRNFEVIACQWVRECADKYHRLSSYRDYMDERDKASAEMCASIYDSTAFQEIYQKITEIDTETEYWEERTLGSMCVFKCTNMHPTLRQTFTGLVLTFLMNDENLKKLSDDLLSRGIVPTKDVSFCMI